MKDAWETIAVPLRGAGEVMGGAGGESFAHGLGHITLVGATPNSHEALNTNPTPSLNHKYCLLLDPTF